MPVFTYFLYVCRQTHFNDSISISYSYTNHILYLFVRFVRSFFLLELCFLRFVFLITHNSTSCLHWDKLHIPIYLFFLFLFVLSEGKNEENLISAQKRYVVWTTTHYRCLISLLFGLFSSFICEFSHIWLYTYSLQNEYIPYIIIYEIQIEKEIL